MLRAGRISHCEERFSPSKQARLAVHGHPPANYFHALAAMCDYMAMRIQQLERMSAGAKPGGPHDRCSL